MLAGNRYAHGNDWARGFMRDMGMRHDGWAAAALAGFLMFTGVPRLLADNDDCQRRVVRADHRLHEAIEHHGYVSHQAERVMNYTKRGSAAGTAVIDGGMNTSIADGTRLG